MDIDETQATVSGTRRRILFMIPTLTGGGAERVVVTILRHLDRQRFDAALAVVDTRNAVFLDDIPKDVELIDLRATRVRYVLPKLLKLIRERRPDVVLSTLGQLNLALAALRPLLPRGIRYLARETIVVTADARTKRWPRLWRSAHRRLYRRFDAIICNSLDMQKDMVQELGIPPQKTVVIHNPVDISRIREMARGCPPEDEAPSGTLRLVSLARLTHQKGIDMLIDAVALSKRSIRVTVFGEGPLRKELEDRAAGKGVAGQVKFADFQKNPYPFLAQADALVLSSRYEGFPNVVLESLACGTPVIALPANGGVREILSGVEGCMIADEISAESLAKAIDSFSAGSRIDPAAIECYAAARITKLYEQEFMKNTNPSVRANLALPWMG